ncbi:MAG: hypothetical protein ABIL70_09795 [candidate division WOR-3 bacterium]
MLITISVTAVISSDILKTGLVKNDRVNSPRSLATYQNEQYSFQIKYNDKDFVIDTKFTKSADNDKRIAMIKFINNEYYYGTNLESAGLYIIVDGGDQATQTSCLKFPEEMGILISTKEININGAIFTVFEAEEGGMSHIYERNIYSTVHNNKCYRIVLFISAAEVGAFDPGTVTQFKKTEVLEKLRQVASMFQFTK